MTYKKKILLLLLLSVYRFVVATEPEINAGAIAMSNNADAEKEKGSFNFDSEKPTDVSNANASGVGDYGQEQEEVDARKQASDASVNVANNHSAEDLGSEIRVTAVMNDFFSRVALIGSTVVNGAVDVAKKTNLEALQKNMNAIGEGVPDGLYEEQKPEADNGLGVPETDLEASQNKELGEKADNPDNEEKEEQVGNQQLKKDDNGENTESPSNSDPREKKSSSAFVGAGFTAIASSHPLLFTVGTVGTVALAWTMYKLYYKNVYRKSKIEDELQDLDIVN